ncbi:MAG: hybrid sensor histidine kinase/response regulator [Pseudomonadota bacterium]
MKMENPNPLVAAAETACILVVDDQPNNLLATQALLADAGLPVLLAESGPQALELLLKHEIAVALLDVQMPGMDGFALAELMRGTERSRHVPILFVTAGAREEERNFRGYEAGAVDFLYKPVDPRVLRSKIAVFIDLHRQRRLLAERIAEQERLARVNALMLSALSHDIREPLTVLTLNAEMLVRRSEQPSLQQAGARMKAAASVLARQVEHLASLASLPVREGAPQLQRADLARLLEERLQANSALRWTPPQVSLQGDTTADFDPGLMGEAIDHLLLQAATHAGDHPLRIELDGNSRRALVLRLGFEAALAEPAARHLFGGGLVLQGMASPQVGHGLACPERIARVHGGSLIGGSRQRQGTWFELMLPRQGDGGAG